MKQTVGAGPRFSVTLKGILCLVVILAAWLLASSRSAPPAEGASYEYWIKAGYLYNFAKYVDWPTGQAQNTITICVAGKSPISAALDTVNGKTASGRMVLVRPFSGTRDLQSCRILFIGASEKDRWAEILGAVKNSSILTVGDEIPGFAQHGGIINFRSEGNSVYLEINNDAAARAGLRISSQLLSLRKVRLVRA